MSLPGGSRVRAERGGGHRERLEKVARAADSRSRVTKLNAERSSRPGSRRSVRLPPRCFCPFLSVGEPSSTWMEVSAGPTALRCDSRGRGTTITQGRARGLQDSVGWGSFLRGGQCLVCSGCHENRGPGAYATEMCFPPFWRLEGHVQGAGRSGSQRALFPGLRVAAALLWSRISSGERRREREKASEQRAVGSFLLLLRTLISSWGPCPCDLI